jgi:hypothetical protein
MKEELLPTGTRIRFTKTLEEPPDGDRPLQTYAERGESGEITGQGAPEGYWARTDRCPHLFGASRNEFEVIEEGLQPAAAPSIVSKCAHTSPPW